MDKHLVFDMLGKIHDIHSNDNPYTAKRPVKIGKKEYQLSSYDMSRAVNKAIQAFMLPYQEIDSKKIQAFSGSSDLPPLTRDVFNVTMQTPNFDLLWQESFKGVELTQDQLDWEIATVDTGLTFKIIPEGGKIEFSDIGGEVVT